MTTDIHDLVSTETNADQIKNEACHRAASKRDTQLGNVLPHCIGSTLARFAWNDWLEAAGAQFLLSVGEVDEIGE